LLYLRERMCRFVSVAMGHPNGPKLMRLVMFTVTLSSMTALMFNIVLPQVAGEFRLTYAEVSWLSSGYSILYAFGTVTYGKLADRFGLKRVLSFGLSLFAAGSLAGLLSGSFWTALLGRCLQAAGAASIPALAMIVPARYFTPERRGRALAMAAAGIALGSALAPVVSSLIAGAAHWRWLFVPPLLLVFLLPFYRKYLAEEPKTASEPFDWMGGALLASAVAALLIGMTRQNAALPAAGLAALALFAVRIRKAGHPFIRPALLQNRRYAAALSLSFVINAIGISLFVLTPLFLADVYGLGAEWIGLSMVPAALASAILGKKGGKLADAKGNACLFRLASSSLIACFLLLSVLAGQSPVWIAAFLVIGHVGQTFMGIAISNTVTRTLPGEQVGVGMGLFSMMNFLAQGIGAGIYGLAAELGAAASWNPLHADPASSLYSNLYLVLAALHLGILPLYLSRFGERRPERPEGKAGTKEDPRVNKPPGRLIAEALTAWPHVEAVPHRFGGTAFLYRGKEIGHIHGDRLVDIPFPKAVRDRLVTAGQAEPHHIHPESGWVSVVLGTDEDAERAVELLRLNYNLLTERNRG